MTIFKLKKKEEEEEEEEEEQLPILLHFIPEWI